MQEITIPNGPRLKHTKACLSRGPLGCIINMKRIILSLLVLGLLSCSTEQPKENNIAKDNAIFNQEDSSVKDKPISQPTEKLETTPQETAETRKLTDIATSFHRWYIKNVNNPDPKIPIEARIVEGNAGKSKVEYEPYFEQLRKLPTVSEKLIEQEKQRISSCAENIGKVDWSVYEAADAYEFDKYCDFLSYYYWIRSQEPITDVEASNLEKSGDSWLATLRFFDEYEGNKNYADHYHPIVKLEKEAGNWKITQITWKEK